MTLSSQDELLLNAYVDGELDPIEATRFEQRLRADAALNCSGRNASRFAGGASLGPS